jgi:hypothetical protein
MAVFHAVPYRPQHSSCLDGTVLSVVYTVLYLSTYGRIPYTVRRAALTGTSSFEEQKRARLGTTRTDSASHSADELKQALIAQHEPPSTAIDGLCAYPLASM